MTVEIETLYSNFTHLISKLRYLGKEIDDTRLSRAHRFLIQQKTVYISNPFPLFIRGPHNNKALQLHHCHHSFSNADLGLGS